MDKCTHLSLRIVGPWVQISWMWPLFTFRRSSSSPRLSLFYSFSLPVIWHSLWERAIKKCTLTMIWHKSFLCCCTIRKISTTINSQCVADVLLTLLLLLPPYLLWLLLIISSTYFSSTTHTFFFFFSLWISPLLLLYHNNYLACWNVSKLINQTS